MRRFAQLYERLDETTSTNTKIAALEAYFREAPAADSAWGLFFLAGGRLKRLVASPRLRKWCIEETQVTPWLFNESYAAVGDLAEAIALLIEAQEASSQSGRAHGPDIPLHEWVEFRLNPLRTKSAAEQRRAVTAWWNEAEGTQLFLLNKLITGAFRVGVSRTLVERALANVAGVTADHVAERLGGEWEPSAEFVSALLAGKDPGDDPGRPYPFHFASPLEVAPERLGPPRDWFMEWKWDGIRAQLLRREGVTHLWSRGGERVAERFPEIVEAARALPDGVVLDGEIVAMRDGEVLPFHVLQRRIGRDRVTRKLRSEAPAGFLVYDLLEAGGEDVRAQPLETRRARLEAILAEPASPAQGFDATIRASSLLEPTSWEDAARLREEARGRGVEGLMLKRRDSVYESGRKRGSWWKWKVDPLTIDAVLVYSQPGSGRRANLHTDHTFALWDGDDLVPVAKAYSGLTDEENRRLDRWIRTHSIERFGPVRRVDPVRVFELAFERVAESSRHRSGLAVRFPRILRERSDKRAAEADSVEALRALAPVEKARARTASLLDWVDDGEEA